MHDKDKSLISFAKLKTLFHAHNILGGAFGCFLILKLASLSYKDPWLKFLNKEKQHKLSKVNLCQFLWTNVNFILNKHWSILYCNKPKELIIIDSM